MTREEILSEIKTRLEQAHGERLQGVILYGSEARGEAAPDSDIDLMVLLKGPIEVWDDIRANVGALYELEGEQEPFRMIHAIPVDIADYEAGEYAVYRNARQEGIRL